MNRKLKILLINPPFEKLKGFSIESMSLGLLSLASVLHENGYKVKVYDGDTTFEKSNLRDDIAGRPMAQQNYCENIENREHPAWKELEKVVLDCNPDIVGISIKTPAYHSSIQTVEIVRKLLPEAVIIVGGPHITITSDNMLQYNAIDFAFYGEAEYSLLEFVKSISSGEDVCSIQGIIYRKGNSIICNDRPERLASLDSLPFPNKDLLIFSKKYKYKLGAIITSRGCPFECTFCATVPLYGRVVSYRSSKSIVEELTWLYNKYKIKEFEILDDTFTLRKKEVIKVCEGLIERFGKKFFRWVCVTNINVLDYELIRYLKKAGCYKINIGIESGSDRILKLIRKNITTNGVRKAIKMIKRNGLLIHGYFMIGFPHETEEDMQKTIDFIKEIKPDSINLCTYTPYPNTRLFDFVIEHKLLDPDDRYDIYKTISTHSDQNYFIKDVSRESYLKYLRIALELVGKVNAKNNWRKIKYHYRNITFVKVKNRLVKESIKLILKYQRN